MTDKHNPDSTGEESQPASQQSLVTTQDSQASSSSVDATNENESVQHTSAKRSRKLLWAVIVILFLLLIAVGAAAGYYIDKLQKSSQNAEQLSAQQQSKLTENYTNLKQIIDETQSTVEASTTQAIASLENKQKDLVKDFSKVESSVSQINKRLTDLSPRDEQRWLLSQVEYFIQMAQYRATLTDDSFGAALLIEQALEAAKQLRSFEAQKLIQALSEDRADLQIDGQWQPQVIHAEISALAQRINQLSLAGYESTDIKGEKVDIIDSNPGLKKIFSRLVRIQKTDDKLKPMLDETTRQQVEQHLFMLLTQAQLNLMRQNQAGYKQSLEQAFAIVDEAFIDQAKETLFFKEELKRLAEVKITQQTIDFSKSVKALRSTVQFFEKQSTNTQQTASSKE